MHFVTSTTFIDEIDGKSHKTELKSSHYYSTNRIKPLVIIYGLKAIHKHTCVHIHTLTFADENDFKKPGARRSAAGVHLV